MIRLDLSSLRKKVLLCCLVGHVFLCDLPAKLQPILHVGVDIFLSPVFHSPKNDYYVDHDNPLNKEKGYGNYHLDKLKSGSDVLLNVGFIARPDRKFAGHSFFGIYKISHLTLAESSLKTRFFHNFCDFNEVRKQKETYSEYLQNNLSRFLWQARLLPLTHWLHSSGQLTNQIFFAYSYSILDALDFSTGISFLSLLPKGTMKQQRSKNFDRSEVYTYNLGFFLRPLDLEIKPKFDEELEMSFFLNYSFHAKQKAQTSFENSLAIAKEERESLQFGNNKNIFSGNWGIFYEKKFSKIHVSNSILYNHQLMFYNAHNGITKEQNSTQYTINKNQLLQKNNDGIENTLSLRFLLPKKKTQKYQSVLTLSVSEAFFVEYAQKGLWEHSKDAISAENLSLPQNHFRIESSPFPIFDAKIFDHFRNNLKMEIKYLFLPTVLVFFHYQWTTSHYFQLSKMARESENYQKVYQEHIPANAHVENLHAFKMGFQYFNDFIEKIEPYVFFAKSINGIFSPKKNQDFWGIGVQFSYLLHPPKK